MYEATISLNQGAHHWCHNFAVVVAKLMLHGMPFEIMDGDTAFIPILWVEAVFSQIVQIVGDKKLFVISVIGIQSFGKIDTVEYDIWFEICCEFWTVYKGLYGQLVPIDKENMRVDCDYILIVDTEGLRAPELQGVSQVHDNELATFVVGLGDVTIVNIKGENNSEINDILQIVIHARIRMKI